MQKAELAEVDLIKTHGDRPQEIIPMQLLLAKMSNTKGVRPMPVNGIGPIKYYTRW